MHPKNFQNHDKQFLCDLFGVAGRLLGKRHRNIAKCAPKCTPTAPTVNQNAAQPGKQITQRHKAAQALRTMIFFTRLLFIMLLFVFSALRPTTLRRNYAKIRGRRGPRSVYNFIPCKFVIICCALWDTFQVPFPLEFKDLSRLNNCANT